MPNPVTKWNLNQWLTDLESRNSELIQLGLERVLAVAQKLKLNSPDCKVVTVAGTNGKGSTVAALETIYHTAGYRVGAYTSPHLLTFNERIRVNLIPIDDEDLCHAFHTIDLMREHISLSYFEFATLAALLYFRQQNIEVMILEVGLGGRLDATNIIDSDVAIITTIDYDHQEYLGNTLEAIAYEKAGIIRENKPFIYADNNPPTSIFTVANQLNALTYIYGRDFSVQEQADTWDLTCFHESFTDLEKPSIQFKSAAAAIAACILLRSSLPVSSEHFYQAMARIFIPGRLQWQKTSKDGVDALYDVSHNPQAARLLANTLKEYTNKKRVHAVFSALKDKDILGLISPLKEHVQRWYLALLDNKRAAKEDYLLSICRNEDILVEFCYNDPSLAFNAALNNAQSGDLIVVFGSFFTVAQVMANQGNYSLPRCEGRSDGAIQ